MKGFSFIKKGFEGMVEGREAGFGSIPDIGRDHHVDHVIGRVSTERRNSGARRKSTVGGWTEEEDERLKEAVLHYDGKNWKMIATKLPGRTDVQCLHRWQKVLDPNLIKGPWTSEEDELIAALVRRHGEKHWSLIAKSLPGRIGKQCRERWNNYLKPGILRTPWTDREDSILLEAHRQFGNKWAELTKLLPGRTENAIKNHWNCTLSKRVDGRSNRRKRPTSNCHSVNYLSSFRMTTRNVGIVMHDPSVVVTTPFNQSTPRTFLDLFDSPTHPVNGSPHSMSTPIPDTKLSLEVSRPESLLKNAADSYKNFPSIIRKRKPQGARVTDSDQDSNRVSESYSQMTKKIVTTSGIMLFGKCLESEFDAAAAAEEVEIALRLQI